VVHKAPTPAITFVSHSRELRLSHRLSHRLYDRADPREAGGQPFYRSRETDYPPPPARSPPVPGLAALLPPLGSLLDLPLQPVMVFKHLPSDVLRTGRHVTTQSQKVMDESTPAFSSTQTTRPKEMTTMDRGIDRSKGTENSGPGGLLVV
jgi:hypothetical protein